MRSDFERDPRTGVWTCLVCRNPPKDNRQHHAAQHEGTAKHKRNVELRTHEQHPRNAVDKEHYATLSPLDDPSLPTDPELDAILDAGFSELEEEMAARSSRSRPAQTPSPPSAKLPSRLPSPSREPTNDGGFSDGLQGKNIAKLDQDLQDFVDKWLAEGHFSDTRDIPKDVTQRGARREAHRESYRG